MPGRLRTAREALEDLDVGGRVVRSTLVRRGARASGWAVMRHLRHAARDDRVEAIQLLVAVEVDHQAAATARAHDADPGGEEPAQLRLEVGQVARRSRPRGAQGADRACAARAPPSGAPRDAARSRSAARRAGARGRSARPSARPWPSLIRPSAIASRVSAREIEQPQGVADGDPALARPCGRPSSCESPNRSISSR